MDLICQYICQSLSFGGHIRVVFMVTNLRKILNLPKVVPKLKEAYHS
jgi:hypothetical protein